MQKGLFSISDKQVFVLKWSIYFDAVGEPSCSELYCKFLGKHLDEGWNYFHNNDWNRYAF